MKRFTKHHKTAVTLGVLVALASLGYYLLFQAVFAEIAKTAEILDEVSREERLHGTVVANEKTLVELQDDLELLDSFFIPADGVVDFIESVETLANNRNLTIDVRNVSLEEISNVPHANLAEELRMRIETRGSWQDNYNFLTQLEHLPYHITFSLSGMQNLENTEGILWQGSFDLTVLKLK